MNQQSLFDEVKEHLATTHPMACDCDACGARRLWKPKRHPRYYQTDAIDAIRTALEGTPLEDAVRSALLVMATGTGKTAVFSELIRTWPGRVLVVAHREELIEQARASLAEQTGERVGVEKAERFASGERIIVGSVQSLRAERLERFPPDYFTLVVVDEGHRGVADSYLRIYRYFAAAKLLLVTATPDRADEKALGAVVDVVAYVFDIEQGIDAGYLVPVKGREFQVDVDLSGIATVGGDLAQGELDEAMLQVVEGVVDQLLANAGAEQAICFTPGVRSAHAMCERANLMRPGCAIAIDGSTEKLLRKQLVSGFKERRFQFLFNCFDMRTEALTKDGWKPGYLVSEGELVATMNMETSAIEWQPATRPFTKPHTKALVHIKNQSIDIRVTRDHRMVTRTMPGGRWHIKAAGELTRAVGPYELPVSGTASFRGAQLTDAELEFVGLFISDGSLNRERASVEICQSLASRNGPAMAVEIERILTECGFDWRSHRYVAPSGFDARPREFVRYRIPKGNIGGSLTRRGWHHLERYLDKSCSELLADCSAEQFERLLYGLWVGDGTKRTRLLRHKRPGYSVSTANPVLVDRLQAMAVSRGFASSSSWSDNGEGCRPLCMVRFRKRLSIKTNNHSVDSSGGNPARFDHNAPLKEFVWCLSTANTTLVVRRNGRVLIAGQCAVATEGFDAPATSIVAIARPTKSRALYAQMVGRGTRVLPGIVDHIHGEGASAARRGAIAASRKPHMTIYDFVGNAGKHALVTPTDVLGGNYSDEEIKEAKKRQQGCPDEDVRTSLKVARDELRRLAVRLAEAKAKVNARTREFDPFVALGMERIDDVSVRFGSHPATQRQKELLTKFGLPKADVAKLDERQAKRLLKAQYKRMDAGLASLKQLATLSKFAPVSADLPFATARRALDYVLGECDGGRRFRVDGALLETILRGG